MLKSMKRRKWITSHQDMADVEFLAQLSCGPEDGALVLAVRAALADCCQIPAQKIHPQSSFAALWDLISSWEDDQQGFVIRLEDQLGKGLDERLLPSIFRLEMPVCDWVAELVPAVKRAIR